MSQPGPCVVCGDTNYPLSCGGPSICPSCDCGVDPELKRCRRKLKEASMDSLDLMIALLVAIGKTGGFTPEMMAIGEQRIARLKAEPQGWPKPGDGTPFERQDGTK